VHFDVQGLEFGVKGLGQCRGACFLRVHRLHVHVCTCACMHDRTYSTHAHAHALAHARTHARTHPGMHAHAHIQSSLFLVADTCRDGPPWCASFGGRGLWCSSLALRWHRSVRSPPHTHARLSLYIVVFILLLTLFCNYLYQLLFVVTCVTHLMQRLCVCVCVCSHSHEIEVDGLRCTCCRV
jgi:hypothetical protein